MKEIRPEKDSDQDNIEKAFQLIKVCMQEHQDIEPSLWCGAVWSVLVDGYRNCGFSYKEFCDEWDRIKEHYKKEWDE